MKTRIAELRRKAGLSQTELADRIGTKITMLGKLERGERDLTSAWIDKLATALNVTPAAIFTPPGDHKHVGWVEKTGDVGEPAADHGDDSLGLQVPVQGKRGQVIAVLGRAVEHDHVGQTPLISYIVEHDPVTISLPKEAQLIVDTSIGGSLREELADRLALITLHDGAKVFGTVSRVRHANSFILVPLGGAPRLEAVISRIDPVVEIQIPTYGLG